MSETSSPQGGVTAAGGRTETPQGAGSPRGGMSPRGSAPHREPQESIFSKIVRIIFAPFVWLARPLVFRVSHERGNPKVYFTSFSSLMYLWPVMIVGLVGPWLAENVIRPDTMGWIWITILWLVILSLGADMDRNKMMALLAIIVILWLGGMLLEAKQGIPILSQIHDYFARQNVSVEPGTVKVFGIIAAIILVLVVISAWFDGRYEITTREITHRRVFRTSDSVPRAAKRIKQDWRDLTEFLLGIGAGDLIVQDTNGNVVLRIPNVPFLWFFRHDVDHILEVLATTDVEDVAAAIAEAEDGA